MSWVFFLTIAVVVGALFAVLGIKPRGARPVAGSRMMPVARIVLVIVIALLLYLYFRGR
jgi:hypothetical protein